METLERLLGRHSKAQVIAWAKRRRYFNFMGEVSSGHLDLYEELRMRLDFGDDPVPLLDALGVLRRGAGDSRVTEHPNLLQPGHCSVAGSKCFVWVHDGFLEVTCSADEQVCAANVEGAVRIEAHVDALKLQARVNRTIATHTNCVSAANFPREFI